MSPRGKIRICLKRALTSTPSSPLTTTSAEQANCKNKKARDSEKSAENLKRNDNDNQMQCKTNRQNLQRKERSSGHSQQFSPLASPSQQQSRPSSSDSSSDPSSPSTEDGDDENPLPAAFRMVNETESSDESGAERSEHEEEVIRRSKQIRNRERWELLKYKMLISSCCTPSKSHNKSGNESPEMAEEEEQWDEEREREFVFSLL